MVRLKDSLNYHATDRPGKIELKATKPCLTPLDLRLAYLPGAVYASAAIAEDPSRIFQYTSKGNLVGVITNGSAVPDLGNVGPGAAKPIQEGMVVLFKRLADIDVFDLELNTTDPERFIETVKMLEPTFGGINLKDIRAREGLEINDRLNECMNIPVFNQNLYSSAVVAAAALINALDLVDKDIEDIRVVMCGTGSGGIGCARLFLKLGVKPENLLMYNSKGLLHPDRTDLPDFARVFARDDPARTLADGIRGADVFLGFATGGIVTQDMVRSMNPYPIVFALATPEPEIGYEAARATRREVVVATGADRFPNAILDTLSFPYIFRGALDVQATQITEGMLIAAARALADLAREEVVEEVERAYGNEHFSFGPEYLLPKAIDPRILVRMSTAVARQAITEGVARCVVQNETYQESLIVRLGTGRETLRGLVMKARQKNLRVVFSDGASEPILRACSNLVSEGIASPILLGPEEEIREGIDRLDLDLGGIQIVDPSRSPLYETYVEEYFRLRCRRGVMLDEARRRVRRRDYFAALMVHTGAADMMLGGESIHYSDALRTILEVIGPAPGVRKVSSHHMVLLPKKIFFLADCGIIIEPDAEDLAETALMAANRARSLGIEPRVAMLSFSSYGSVDHPSTRKVRKATQIAKELAPDLIIDGEVQLSTALNSSLRQKYFPFSELKNDANVLIFPDVQAGNIALELLSCIGEAVSIGPLLTGTRMPAHLRQYGVTAEEVVNLTTVGVVEASATTDRFM
ncbi:MAG: phosphate acyltransferase [Syntrophobacteraceae bacterium]|nr:NADP-dependent malic enzyme [Desulfobacteraceae bacterium]